MDDRREQADTTESSVYLGLGSNLGDREAEIRRGLERLEAMGAVRVIAVSSLYETEPVGWTGGPWYLNGVARAISRLGPEALLTALKDVERQAGRMPGARNAPRPLDLDLLIYENQTIRSNDLEVPHPRMLDRAFVLRPLAELAPELEILPGLTAGMAEAELPVCDGFRRWRPENESPDAGKSALQAPHEG
ncbi:MAG TPA: 2-amino-4-hydroxy-6-hydroxymethyldihydropteridine diphosphokinase [Armatimonadota bacterium]|nr:2-amino-4-hydroxy-6-hydroxymethyldihydropteridine diphosphokinase [Armatimonadota bacterium]